MSFSRSCLYNSSSFHLIDAGPLSSFSERSSSASSFHASLLQVVDGVMSLPFCPQVVSQAPQHFRSSETSTTCGGCFSRQSVCSDISLHSACSGQYIHSFRRWMSTIDDLRKSRGLHSVSAYRHGLYIYIYRSMPAGVAQSSHGFVGGTVSTWAR